ncbi:MAG: AMP-dependent synthetase/ligase [Acidimicrobiia bacterium]
MQTHTQPGSVVVDPTENLTSALWEAERSQPDLAILAHRVGDTFIDVTFAGMASQVRRIAAGLMALGVQPGDRVAVFSPTRIEFTLIDYAVWAAGAATVTIYETSAPEQVGWIVTDSGARVIICADAHLESVYRAAGAACEHVLTLDDGGLDHLLATGAAITDEEVIQRAASVAGTDLASLVYTSGTTGKPKGCELTVGSFVWESRQVAAEIGDVLHEGAVTLMFLPLAHIFARVAQVASIMNRSKIAYSTGIPNLMEELAIVQPTWLFAVPRVFEKVYNSARSKADAEGKARIFDLAARVAGDYSRHSGEGRVPLGTRLGHAVFDRLVYAKLRHALGGRLRYAVSGGAALGERLGHFFNGIGITVLEGYGLTENVAVAAFNRPGAVKIGTVGCPVAGSTIGIADDGEILVAGPHVFRGYWNNPAATAEAIDPEGWLRTGDIGAVDEDGYVRITGRKKELLVTAGGKNVAPAPLEDRLRAHPLLSQVMVVGDGKPYVGALVTLDPEQAAMWAAAHGKAWSLEALPHDHDLIAEIQQAVDEVNGSVSKAESIRRFVILDADFTIEEGEMTPTLKVRRNVVAEHFSGEIERLYQS